MWKAISPHHRLNMKLGLQSLIGLHVHSCTQPRNPPPPQYLGSYTRALLVSQDRRHLVVTPPGPGPHVDVAFACWNCSIYEANTGRILTATLREERLREGKGMFNFRSSYLCLLMKWAILARINSLTLFSGWYSLHAYSKRGLFWIFFLFIVHAYSILPDQHCHWSNCNHPIPLGNPFDDPCVGCKNSTPPPPTGSKTWPMAAAAATWATCRRPTTPPLSSRRTGDDATSNMRMTTTFTWSRGTRSTTFSCGTRSTIFSSETRSTTFSCDRRPVLRWQRKSAPSPLISVCWPDRHMK